jgi:hypothetical protein
LVNCPKCGKPLVKGGRGKSRYYCKTEDCPVIFVRYTKDSVYVTLADENGLEKLEEVTVKRRVIFFERRN